MPQQIGNDRIIIRVCADEPFDLDGLGDAFAGLAAQYRKLLNEFALPDEFPTRLLVTDVRTGSITIEIGYPALVLYGIYQAMFFTADGFLVFTEFYRRMRLAFEYFTSGVGRPSNLTKDDVQNYNQFLKTLTGKPGAKLQIRRAKSHEKTKRREILAEFEFDEHELSNAGLTIAREVGQALDEEYPAPKDRHRTEKGVPFHWFRADKDRARRRGQTSDRGYITSVSDKPLPVFFASETDKRRMTLRQNPLTTVFIVNAVIELDNDGEPQSYMITDVHGTIIGGPAEADIWS